MTAASDWNKTHIVHRLARARGYRRYLEICTPITGGRYAEIDPSQFESCRRLMYRCPGDFHDGLPVDYRSADNAIDACLDKMRRTVRASTSRSSIPGIFTRRHGATSMQRFGGSKTAGRLSCTTACRRRDMR